MLKSMTVLSLDGCDKCKNYVDEIKKLGLPVSVISCDQSTDLCDTVEHLVKCDMYPMTMLEQFNNESIILCLALEYSQVNKKKSISHNKSVVYFHSIDDMLSFVKNVYYDSINKFSNYEKVIGRRNTN